MIGFITRGIVGFLRILEENDDEFAIRKNNYIEFDTENLRNFHKYYFNYFFKKYNVAENVENRTKNSFEYLENNIEIVWDDKEREKELKDKIKSNKKYIKESPRQMITTIAVPFGILLSIYTKIKARNVNEVLCDEEDK